MFDNFKNIRTFPAKTMVYIDGVFAPELSEDRADLPLHIIHIGKITGDVNWFIDMNEQQDVFLTTRIETEHDTKIRIEINTNLPNLLFDGKIFVKNTGNLMLDIKANNNSSETKVICKTKLFATKNSENILTGISDIPSDVLDAETNISFSALCEPNVKLLKISPQQRISSIPKSATHDASIFRPAQAHIQYLETAGIENPELLLNQVFLEEVI